MEKKYELVQKALSLLDTSATTGSTVETNAACLDGRVQYRQQVLPSLFVPGQWVVHPVTMIKHTVTSRDGTAVLPVKKTAPFANGFVVKGPFCSRNISFDANGLFATIGTKPNFTAWDTQLADLALTKAYDKLASADVFDVGVFLGELPETIGMLRKPLGALVKFLQGKDFKSPSKLLDASSGTWLEYRYGIRPLLGDIQDILELNENGIRKMNTALTVKRATVTTTGDWYGNFTAAWGNISSQNGTAKSMWKRKVTAGIGFRPETGLVPSLARFGLAPHQLPGIAWELTKLSFVLDWIFNVGKWIKAITPNPSITILGNFISQKTTEVVDLRIPQLWGGGVFGGRTVLAPFHTTIETECLRRITGSTLPALPTLEVDIVKLVRVVDSIALLWQSLPKPWRSGYKPDVFLSHTTPKNIRRI